MCGIAGQYCYNGGQPDRRLLAAMSERLAHRGPDGEGSHVSERIGLIHRRLSIIDLSPDGLQPMTNEDRSLWLVFNGEIYNFVELREELVKKGHVFYSRSDTEVILHAYEQWGRDCLSRFNGMWAFALWDEKKQELFCARDRFGIKPFYYTTAAGSFLFASEIKALLAHPAVGKHPDREILGIYLAWGVQDHCGRTMFGGISQIEPGHAMVVGRDGKAEPFRYWDVTINPALSDARTDAEVAARLRGLLHDATRIHLRSDVAVGTCLSGGIDSSALTAIISGIIKEDAPESVGARQKTFSVVFPKTQYDESRYIDEVVAAAGVDAAVTEPDPADLETEVKRLVYMQDEPFGSLSIYAQYCVMRLAKTRVKVVLDGQGADELLAGYLGYQASYIRGLAKRFRFSAAFSEALGSIKEHRGFFATARAQLRARRGRRGLLPGSVQPVDRYAGTLDEVLHRELVSTNLPALLHYEDRNAMAFSIESRVPYLDVRLVEYIAGLPLDQKIRKGVTKWSLRAAIEGLVPDSIRCRSDKMGFVTPEECWMKNELREFIQGLFSSESFCTRPYWNAKAVKENYDAFLGGTSVYSPEIWRIACTELWLRTFIDRTDGILAG